MKSKFFSPMWRVAIALVMVLSLSLVTAVPAAATTVEDTAPAAPVAALLVVTSGTPDTIDGLAGAVAIEVPPVTVTVYSDALTQELGSVTAAPAGSFTAIDISTDTNAEVWVTATDAAGNESPATSKLNDILGPSAITSIVGLLIKMVTIP